MTVIPKVEVRATGTVRYRCADCGRLMDPRHSVTVDGRTWHPEHAPKETDRGR